MEFSKLLQYIPGVIIFLVGSGQVRDWLRLRRAELNATAEVAACSHVVKKDKKDRDVMNYYNVTVEFVNPATHHRERQVIKSPTEYSIGQQVRVVRGRNERNIELMANKSEFVLNPWAMMIGGALLILLALENNRGHFIRAMICLAVILAGAGACLIWNYVSVSRKGLVELDGEIVSVYTRQLSKGTKILKGDKYTYYPVVRYQLDGRENTRRCNINSGSEKAFKTGDHMKLYYDPVNEVVLEKHANPLILVVGIVLAAAGVLAGLSILSVVLPR